jgi:hypothetical protein
MHNVIWIAIVLTIQVIRTVMARRPPMGFTPDMPVYRLNFEDTELDGLIVRTNPCTIEEWNEMLRGQGEQNNGKEVADANDKATEKFLQYVVSWNLEIPAGTPVPITVDGFNKLGTRHGAMIITAWQRAMTEVPTNSRPGSSSGEVSQEQQLGLVSSSESLPSWNEPN